jgi:acyl carrier protein
VLVEFLHGLTARVVGATPSQVSVQTPLARLGLDSLMAVEMRHVLHRELGVEVPVVALMQAASVDRLADDLAERMGARPPAPATQGLEGDVVEGEL